MAMVLYDYELSADAYTVRLALALLGLAYERRAVDVYPGREHETAEFRALAPLAAVPVLCDGGLVVETAEAILCHLAEVHDPEGVWWPRARRSAVLKWVLFAARSLAAAAAARLEAILRQESPYTDAAATAQAALEEVEDHLVRADLVGEAFLAGPAPTIADLAVFPAAALSADWGLGHEDLPKLRCWTRRVRALPGFITMPGIAEFL